ncbi:MAG: hypothetical protein RLZZ631_1281 [Cyanobacteriota bacterium]
MLLMLSPADSMVAMAAEVEAEHAARMATPWMLMWSSDRPADHAMAMTWLGRRMGEMFWRFEIAMLVDEVGEKLKRAELAPEPAEPAQQ